MNKSNKETGEPWMALTTFGSIMGYAAEMVKDAEETYKTMASKAKERTLREFLESLSIEESKAHATMIKARQENVTEMILEPVTGLRQEDYEIDSRDLEPQGDTSVLRTVLLLEERERKFFRDASTKVPLPEVARLFKKMLKKKEDNLNKLRSLGLIDPFDGNN